MGKVRRRDYFLQSLKQLSNGITNEDWTKCTVELAKVRLQQLESTWEKLETLHLELLDRDDAAVADQNYINDAQQMYAKGKATLLRHISEMMNTEPMTVPATPSPSELSVEVNESEMDLLNKIGIFNGEFAKWCDFRNRFIANVHTNTSLRNVQKLNMLKTAVTDRAARVLGKWQLTDANYELAWTKLCGFYNNQYQIARAHIQSLQTLPRLETATFDSIFDLIDRVMYAQRQLSTMGVPVDEWDLMVIYLVEERLDDCSRDAWIDYRENKKIVLPKWNDMSEFLQRRAIIENPAHPPRSATRHMSMALATSTVSLSTDFLDESPASAIDIDYTPRLDAAERSAARDEQIQRTFPKRKLFESPPRAVPAKKPLTVEPAKEPPLQLKLKPMPQLINQRRRYTICGDRGIHDSNESRGDCIVCGQKKNARFVDCQECDARGHFSCLRREKMIKFQENERNWRCSKCLRCAMCNSTQKLGLLFKCHKCCKRYHLNCQKKQPENVQKKTFKCDNCK